MRFFHSVVVAAALAAPLAACAGSVTYNPINYVSPTASNNPFSYGYGTGSSFTAYPSAYSTFQGTPGTYFAIGQDGLPTVGYSSQGIKFGTVNVPSSELWLHPGNAPTGMDTIVQFTAPTAGEFYTHVSFTRRDTKTTTSAGTTGGDGTLVSVYAGGVLLASSHLTGASGATFHFASGNLLTAGETLDFVVNDNGGSYYNDSTGLGLTVSQTPEPSSLALLGTGVLGVASFARRKLVRS